ncbi:MAG: NAD(+) synthase [Paludibacteraceae bacterium]|nr:NAD(+) synthase [Paludibacteraceae bacterium]MBN2787862.1 NAD(+) synthase [Paludibacteraceae bacterium]
MNHGFIKVAGAIPSVKVADCKSNTASILGLIKQAVKEEVQLICFPELAITAYTCADLFHNQLLLDEAEKSLSDLLEATKNDSIICIVGLPVKSRNQLFNSAAVFQWGKLLGIVPKNYLASYNEFYESRWFSSAQDAVRKELFICGQRVPLGNDILFSNDTLTFSVEICEDFWTPLPPSSYHALAGSQLLFNLSASNELIGKHTYRKQLITQQSARCMAGYVYVSSGFGESSTDLLFSGNAIVCENGTILAENERFSLKEQLVINDIDIERLSIDRQKNSGFMQGLSTQKGDYNFRTVAFEMPIYKRFVLNRDVFPFPFIPTGLELNDRCHEIFNIQVNALATRLHHTGIDKLVIGISGGLDSTLALLVCVKTCDKLGINRKNIQGITMPGFGTSERTYNNAIELITTLGVSLQEISIIEACNQHFKDINHQGELDITYENVQARERTQILMDLANQQNALVIGTGDMSELALGWATYNGDHMSMYAVNTGIPKTLVRYLVKWVADNKIEQAAKKTLLDVIDTPVSPELLPTDNKGNIAQKTEDLVGPYELHDFYLYYMLRFGFRPAKIFFLAKHAFRGKYDEAALKKWLKVFIKRFFSQQFKRSCMPDGPKVGSINLSPRGDWRMPSDASAKMWLDEVEKL